MKNFFKCFAYVLPALIFAIGSIYFCIHEPVFITVTRIIAVCFYAIIISIFFLFGISIVVWSLKNTFLYIFKINLFNSKKG